LGYGRIVFIKKDGGFQAHKVETGILFENQIQVRSGLAPGDSVAANAQYLADSEGFIKTNN
jgi:Cu(I)/Ag(I) efflux system membrane fusion protein